jgi:hypothetical protein
MRSAVKHSLEMSTLFFLMGQYGSRAVIPVEEVRRDYFPHLNLVNFIRRCDDGEIGLSLMRAEKSQKSARGVHIQDLANYIDKQRAAVRQKQYDKDEPRS